LTGSIRFYKPETKESEPNPNQAKPKKTEPKPSQTEKTEPNRFELVFVLKNQTEPKLVGLNRFRFAFGVLKKISLVTFFFIKTEPNRK
jgi:hypothetical protein